MGGNEVVLSALYNPALVSITEKKSIRFNYFNRYGLKELGIMGGSVYFPNDFLSVSFDFSSFGFDAFRETMFRLSFSKHLHDKWTLGISTQYALLQTDLFEERPASLSTDIGITYSPVDNVLTGLLIMNLPSVSLGNKMIEIKDFKYYLLQIGFQWEIIDNMFISSSLSHSKEHKLTVGSGIEYILFDSFCIRAGVGGIPFLPSFGAGYSFSHFTVDVAAVYHPVLGVSTGLGLRFGF
jgi:hypothetical protein